jgi:hypothetical protein
MFLAYLFITHYESELTTQLQNQIFYFIVSDDQRTTDTYLTGLTKPGEVDDFFAWATTCSPTFHKNEQ